MIPAIADFVPLPQQWEVIRDIRTRYDYSLGTHEVLLSGSVGSAKSLLLAHLIATHALTFRKAHIGVGRRVLKDLRDTLISVLKEHLTNVEFEYNASSGVFKFQNGSIVRPFSWADGHYKKFRSHEFTMFVIEELTENDEEEFYLEIFNRLGRRRDVPETLIVNATNPDDPEHWAYQRFFVNKNPRRHVYKTKTADNPYLPRSYIEALKSSMDPKLWLRMGEGEWIPIRTEMVYHQYDSQLNYRDRPYDIQPGHPIRWCWDFNIGDGKPLSSCFMQYAPDPIDMLGKDMSKHPPLPKRFHVYQDLVISGLRTEDMCEEALERGFLDHDTTYILHGDATGKHRDTRSKHNDWEIIEKFMANARTKSGKPIRFRKEVPLANPKVRSRHNIVNAQLCNANKVRNLFVYKGAGVAHQGLMLTKLKPGADYVEDDSKEYQHVTTAIGYGVVRTLEDENRRPGITTTGR